MIWLHCYLVVYTSKPYILVESKKFQSVYSMHGPNINKMNVPNM